MPSTFPLEIEEIILNFLADEEGHSALKTCSLVCQTFLPICRKHIFRSIVLNDKFNEITPSTTHAFERLLRETPEIEDYIRKLDYTIPTDLTTSTSIRLEESLKRISRLEFLTVRDLTTSRFHWSNNPIRPALLHLLHLPTLTHFQVDRVIDFILSDLIPCVNLKYLDIGNDTTVAAENTFPATLPEQPIQLNEFLAGIRNPGSSAIMNLFTARRPDGQPIIDFGSLSKITMSFPFHYPNQDEATQALFRCCHALTRVNISFWNPRNVRPSLADMLRPSMQTLKHIVVDIYFSDDVDPLFGIPSELNDMRIKNIIETVTFRITVDTDEGSHLGDDWGRLDEVLTASGWFSLKQVSLAIEVSNLDWEDIELEEALRKLPETHFPRLSSSNSISFNFEFISTWV